MSTQATLEQQSQNDTTKRLLAQIQGSTPTASQEAGFEVQVGRQRFSSACKRNIVAQLAACKHGEIGLF